MVALLILSLASAACAAGEHAVVVGVDERTVAGPLVALRDGNVRLGAAADGDDPVAIPLDKLVSLTLAPAAHHPPVVTTVLEFANGDRLSVDFVETQDDAVVVQTGNARLRVPLDVLRGIVFRTPSGGNDTAAVLLRETGENDLVLLENGDRIAGQWVRLTDRDLVMNVDDHETRMPRDRVTAVAFSPELTVAREPAGARQIVHTDAGWLTVSGLNRDDEGRWSAETAFEQPIGWPANAVRRVQFAGDNVVFLSDLEPARVEFVPYLDRLWPVRFDRDVTGAPLAANGEAFAKGLGVHSRCRITYELHGDYRTFSTVAGLAASAGTVGSVEFAVEVDGREVVRSGPVTTGDAPLRISNLDVQDAATLVLTVDFGRNGDVLDRANWCDAILVK